jgi:hypothetical protein
MHWSQLRLCRKIGESLSFPKMCYSMPINIFFIVKNHWEPSFTDNPRIFTWPPLWSSGQSSRLQNGDVLFPVRYELFYMCYVEERTPPLWSSTQCSWLQIQRPGFDSRCYQIFWEVVGLERGPLSLVSTTEELLGRESSSFGLENREYGSRDPSRWWCGTLYPQNVTLISPTGGGRSVDVVHSRT